MLVRAEPRRAAPRLAVLDFDVVATPNGWREAEDDGTTWVQVQLADGREGWVAGDYVHSMIGYRAGFVRRAGQWWLRVLVAGD